MKAEGLSMAFYNDLNKMVHLERCKIGGLKGLAAGRMLAHIYNQPFQDFSGKWVTDVRDGLDCSVGLKTFQNKIRLQKYGLDLIFEMSIADFEKWVSDWLPVFPTVRMRAGRDFRCKAHYFTCIDCFANSIKLVSVRFMKELATEFLKDWTKKQGFELEQHTTFNNMECLVPIIDPKTLARWWHYAMKKKSKDFLVYESDEDSIFSAFDEDAFKNLQENWQNYWDDSRNLERKARNMAFRKASLHFKIDEGAENHDGSTYKYGKLLFYVSFACIPETSKKIVRLLPGEKFDDPTTWRTPEKKKCS